MFSLTPSERLSCRLLASIFFGHLLFPPVKICSTKSIESKTLITHCYAPAPGMQNTFAVPADMAQSLMDLQSLQLGEGVPVDRIGE